MNFKEFKNELLNRLNPILNQDVKGEVLSTSWEGITEGLPIYIMGINPGGGNQTIESQIKNLPESTATYSVTERLDGNKDNPNWSDYLDNKWQEPKPGEKRWSPIQTHLHNFFKEFNIDLRGVCGTNLVFVASEHPDLKEWKNLEKNSWEAHKLIMGIVKPKLILTYGAQPRDFLMKMCYDKNDEITWSKHEHSRLRCISYTGKLKIHDNNFKDSEIEVRIISVPHLGRYSLTNKPDLMKWISPLITESF